MGSLLPEFLKGVWPRRGLPANSDEVCRFLVCFLIKDHEFTFGDL